MLNGKIMKGIAGFYYVHVAETGVLQSDKRNQKLQSAGGIVENGGFRQGVIYACRARGIFRKEGNKPLVGDDVAIEVTDEKDLEGNIVSIQPRKNELFRPPAANVDQAVVFFACRNPEPNRNLLDRFLVTMERLRIPVVLCFNKKDLADEERIGELAGIYSKTGYPVFFTNADTGEGVDRLSECLQGKTSVLSGPSGVGKSTLINQLSGQIRMETGEISQKTGRGRHTTRHVQLLPLGGNTYLMDTPGFTSLTLETVNREELSGLFPEFRLYESFCRFSGCSHITEPACGIRDALEKGRISRERYDSYCVFYREISERRRRP